MEKKSKIQKVEKLNKATIEFTSERGDFRIIINDQVREDDEGFTMPKVKCANLPGPSQRLLACAMRLAKETLRRNSYVR